MTGETSMQNNYIPWMYDSDLYCSPGIRNKPFTRLKDYVINTAVLCVELNPETDDELKCVTVSTITEICDNCKRNNISPIFSFIL